MNEQYGWTTAAACPVRRLSGRRAGGNPRQVYGCGLSVGNNVTNKKRDLR